MTGTYLFTHIGTGLKQKCILKIENAYIDFIQMSEEVMKMAHVIP